MSGMTGIFHQDRRPVNADLLRRMNDAIAHRGIDGSGFWLKGAIGLAHQMLCTTAEALTEKQPLLDEAGELCLVLDGRIDNREEIKTALAASDFHLRADTDAEIILRAYQCWGEACPAKIIGDFAFVIWDGRHQKLFCARDVFGIKPFYYRLNGQTFFCGSEVRQFFADKNFTPRPNEGMVAEFLADTVTSKAETLYQNIYRLPPAHCLVVDADGVRTTQYWFPAAAKEIRYKKDSEYTEHFLTIFTETLRACIRSHKPVGAHLSGGLDSSSVVGLIQSLIQIGVIPDHGFETFSLLFPRLSCDESNYIQAVVQMCGVKNNTLQTRKNAAFQPEIARESYYFPSPPNGRMLDGIKKLAHEKGIRVLLTGIGGDEWFAGSHFHYADLLRQGKFISLFRTAWGDKNLAAKVSLSHPIFQYGVFPLLRSLIPNTARDLLRKFRGETIFATPIDPQFAQRVHLLERVRCTNEVKNFKSFARQDIFSVATSGWQTFRFELENRDDAEFSLETRHPLHDRRIAEFALSLPADQLLRQGQPKFILRQAMCGLIPETVRQRLTKAEFSHLFIKAFQAMNGEHLLNDLAIDSMGWVNKSQAQSFYRQMMHLHATGDESYTEYSWTLWMIIGIDLWFRKVFINPEFTLPREL